MQDACFSPQSLALLAVIGAALQSAILGLFWIVIRSKDDATRDAREMRDRALDINERAISAGETSVHLAQREADHRGRRS